MGFIIIIVKYQLLLTPFKILDRQAQPTSYHSYNASIYIYAIKNWLETIPTSSNECSKPFLSSFTLSSSCPLEHSSCSASCRTLQKLMPKCWSNCACCSQTEVWADICDSSSHSEALLPWLFHPGTWGFFPKTKFTFFHVRIQIYIFIHATATMSVRFLAI